MESDIQKKTPVLRPAAVFFASFGLAIALTIAFAILACSFGFLFSGVDPIITVLFGTFFSAIVATISSVRFKQTAKRFGWRMVWGLVPFLALFSVVGVSLTQIHLHLKVFMAPAPTPSSLRIYHGRGVMFGSFVHFTSAPSDIAALIQAKELVQVPDWDPNSDAQMPENFAERERRKTAWDWWQPASMSGAKFYYRHHKSEAIQGWAEGWWVNDKTNEVFAYVGG